MHRDIQDDEIFRANSETLTTDEGGRSCREDGILWSVVEGILLGDLFQEIEVANEDDVLRDDAEAEDVAVALEETLQRVSVVPWEEGQEAEERQTPWTGRQALAPGIQVRLQQQVRQQRQQGDRQQVVPQEVDNTLHLRCLL